MSKQLMTTFKTQHFPIDELLVACGGLILGQAVLWGTIRPFALAWLTAAILKGKQQGLFVFVAVFISSWGLGFGGEMVATVLVALALLVIFWAENFWHSQWWLAAPLTTVACNLIGKGIFYFLPMPYWYHWSSIVLESLLIGLFVLVSQLVLELSSEWNRINEDCTMEEKAALIMTVMAFLLGLSNWQIAGLDVQSIASRLVILITSYWYGSGSGAILGVLVGLIPSFWGGIATSSMGFYGLAGLLSGLLKNKGKLAVWLGFLSGNLLLMLYFASSQQILFGIIETFLAGAIFAVLPLQQQTTLWLIPEQKPLAETDAIEQEKMTRIGRIFAGLSEELATEATENTEETARNALEQMYQQIYWQVCHDCPKWQQCWEKDSRNLYQELSRACDFLDKKGRNEHTFSSWFHNRCRHSNEMEIALLNQMALIKQKNYYQTQLTAAQETIAKQLADLAAIVDHVAHETDYGQEAERQIRLQAQKEQWPLEKIHVYENKENDWEIALQFKNCLGAKNCHHLAEKLSKWLKRQYIQQTVVCAEKENDSCQMHFIPQKSCQVVLGSAQMTKNGSDISGDHWRLLELSAGKTAIILSDGMGSGRAARQQSATTVNLLERLLLGGATHQMALEIINDVLLLRAKEESFATIDLLLLDLISARLELIKISAAPSFIKRQTMVRMFKSCSLPVGILEEVDSVAQEYPLLADDLLIMMSDGVYDALPSAEAWQETIKNLPTNDAQMTADYLLAIANSHYDNDHNPDDMTVLVIQIKSVQE